MGRTRSAISYLCPDNVVSLPETTYSHHILGLFYATHTCPTSDYFKFCTTSLKEKYRQLVDLTGARPASM